MIFLPGTQTIGGPCHKLLWRLELRAGDLLIIDMPDGSKANYHGSGRHTPAGYREGLYLDPEDHYLWRVLKESQPEPVSALRRSPTEVCVRDFNIPKGTYDTHATHR